MYLIHDNCPFVIENVMQFNLALSAFTEGNLSYHLRVWDCTVRTKDQSLKTKGKNVILKEKQHYREKKKRFLRLRHEVLRVGCGIGA